MIHSNPIGVFDSGVGGLSVLQTLKTALPEESFIYVADNAHAPYGDRSREFVEERVSRIAGFFHRRGAKAMVLACNTASVIAARRLRSNYSLPVVAMEPAIKPAVRTTRSGVILVLATTNTIYSESVAQLCRLHGESVRIILQPCPGLADLVEQGNFRNDTTLRLLENFIRPGLLAGADTIVLGCTHYLFLKEQIVQIAGQLVAIVEPMDAIARQLSRVIGTSTRSQVRAPIATEFFTTGDPRAFRNFLAIVEESSGEVRVLTESKGDMGVAAGA